MKPPPFATPPQNRSRGRGTRQSMGVGSPAVGTPARRGFVKKKGFFQKYVPAPLLLDVVSQKSLTRHYHCKKRISDIPSTIAFEISQFPQNIPLPAPTTSASIIGGSMHVLHMFIRISQIRKVPDSDLGWEDMYREGEGESWFDWVRHFVDGTHCTRILILFHLPQTTPVSGLLILLSFLNALHLFTRIKLYRLFKRQDPVSSPHANFVAAQLDHEPLEIPSLFSRMITSGWYSFSCSWRFLLGMKPPRSPITPKRTARVQQLEMWVPGELEIMLFSVYSPAHSLLWTATDSSNWMRMFLVMGLVGAQVRYDILEFQGIH